MIWKLLPNPQVPPLRRPGRARPLGAARPAATSSSTDGKFRRLGDSDLEVSEISLGSWLTYSGGVEREHTEACTRAAFDAGINFFDTANVYGAGAAEEAWGEILSGYDRDSYVLATKVYFPMSDSRPRALRGADRQADRRFAAAAADRPRRPLPVPPLRHETSRSRRRWRRSPRSSSRARRARSGSASGRRSRSRPGSRSRAPKKFVSSQPQYNMIWRAPEAEVFPLCAEHGISQIVWSPLAQGVLSGKYEPGSRAAGRLARRQRRDGLRDQPLHGRPGCSRRSSG